MRKHTYFILTVGLFFASNAAFAIPVEDFVTEINTYITHVQAALNEINTASNLANTGSMLTNQIKNLTNLKWQTWDNAKQSLNILGNTAKQADGSLTYELFQDETDLP